MFFDKNEKTTDMVRARSDEGSKNPNQEDTPMTKTEKAETAAEDATGITNANVEPATDSSPADTEIESPAPPAIPEISTDEP